MPLLDAALAFCLSMLGLATAVTMVVGVLQRFFSLREEMLKKLLVDFFDCEVVPTAQADLLRLGDQAAAKASADVTGVVNHLTTEAVQNEGLQTTRQNLISQVDTQRLIQLSSADIVHELRTSPMGVALQRDLGQASDAVFTGLAHRWGQINAKAGASFARRAGLWSAITALTMAFLFNVDSFYLLSSYLNNSEERGAVIAQQQTLLMQYQQALRSDDPPATTTAEGASAAAPDPASQVEDQIKDLRQQVETLKTPGFPAGWNLYPNCPATSSDGRCIAYWQTALNTFDLSKVSLDARGALNGPLQQLKHNKSGLFHWLLGCLLTGLLAGLGAPFWYDVLTGLTSVAQRLRTATTAQTTTTTTNDAGAPVQTTTTTVAPAPAVPPQPPATDASASTTTITTSATPPVQP
jgi:hypothetical protein